MMHITFKMDIGAGNLMILAHGYLKKVSTIITFGKM